MITSKEMMRSLFALHFQLRFDIKMVQYLIGLTLSLFISAYFLGDESATSTSLDVPVHGGVFPFFS